MSAKSPSPIDRHVGGRVRMRRLILGLSQERLGSVLGVTFQQVQKYEKGTNRIGGGRLHAIAGALGVPVEFFFAGHEDAGAASMEPRVEPMPELDRLTIELLQAFNRIKRPALRRSILDLTRAAASEDEVA